MDRFLGGTFGFGLRGNVKRGLAFLSLNYEPGDEIYLFGFSRGAYSARALAGVIGAAGIPKQIEFRELERVWNYYRLRPKFLQRSKRKAELREELSELTFRPAIECVGVWDTVGSYGIPAGYGLGALARLFTAWTRGFHDSEIGKHVKVGLHALAVDERRRPFAPNLWAAAKNEGRIESHVEQVWFPGSHSNIGGGYWKLRTFRSDPYLDDRQGERVNGVAVRSGRTLKADLALFNMHSLLLQPGMAH